jgi:asparagine synthase (glutamine-hydrolysing)
VGTKVAPPDGALIDRMTDVLKHRGPNDRGTWTDAQVALGHRRLSVIDLSSAGREPMSNEDGSIQVVFNGEIYNFRELKEKYRLGERHTFRSATDIEVVIHLFEEKGLECVPELNGMYALAIWDARQKKLHLIRDRYGIKPLFYQKDANYFRFASEIKGILADERVPRKASLQAMHDFLTFCYVPGRETAFEGIYEVPAGCWLTIDAQGGVKEQRYWEPRFETDASITEAMAIEQSRELMSAAVKRQLIADVPVGVLLSGGMDSSTLVAMMSRHRSEPIHTYSVGFEDPSFNELEYARIVAKEFKTIAREVVVTPQLVRDMLPKYLSWIDEPYGDGSAIPTFYVCELAKDEVVVLLSGEGGDEAFAGYDTHAAYKASQWFRRVPSWVRHGLIAPVVYALPVSHKKLSLEFRAKRFVGGQDLEPWQAHLWWRIVLTEAQKRELYTPRVLEQLQPEEPVRHFREVFGRSSARDAFNRILHLDAAVFLPDDLMVKNDRMSMAHSLEARVPMTDNELTEYLERVPPKVKLPGLRKKYVMREAMRGLLPEAILTKKKVGLEMPYSRWFTNELKDVLMKYCGPQRIAETGMFRPEAAQRLIGEHLEGKHDHGRALWGLLNYMMWMELYIP